ncbi:hypothetical protein [Cryptosporangium sp. NPDC051539]|uniref:hypothetical protein n=1 Tax=Cryptosporangium sp. NPDC051539 TaxID=3363962 RepID=UPI0037912BB2
MLNLDDPYNWRRNRDAPSDTIERRVAEDIMAVLNFAAVIVLLLTLLLIWETLLHPMRPHDPHLPPPAPSATPSR